MTPSSTQDSKSSSKIGWVTNKKLSQGILRLEQIALSVAKTSEGVGRNKNFRLGAVLYDKKERPIVSKPNSYKTHPKLRYIYPYPCLHAEASCILSHGLDNCVGLNLLVVRVLASGRKAMAKPCPCCAYLIEQVQINEVVYSNWLGELVRYEPFSTKHRS